jgi:hypothetical protein
LSGARRSTPEIKTQPLVCRNEPIGSRLAHPVRQPMVQHRWRCGRPRSVRRQTRRHAEPRRRTQFPRASGAAEFCGLVGRPGGPMSNLVSSCLVPNAAISRATSPWTRWGPAMRRCGTRSSASPPDAHRPRSSLSTAAQRSGSTISTEAGSREFLDAPPHSSAKDRGFESCSLQRRVCLCRAFQG